jgi:WS/DGAT/MGAT family acyltransferase
MPDALEAHIGPVDAFTVTLERDPLLRATIVAVATFDGTPDWEVLGERVERATRLSPRFREKLVESPLGLAPPRWVLDPEFDLSLHLRRSRVHRQGGMEDVIEFARVAGLTAFDRDRPLWEFTLFEDLPDDRSALVMKIHHSLTDGIGGVDLAAHVVDLEPEPPTMGEMPPAPRPRSHGIGERVAESLGFHGRRVIDAADGLARALARNAVHLARAPVDAVTDGVETAVAIARFVRPVTRTGSPVMTGRRTRHHHLMLDVPLPPLLAAAHDVGSTLNDAFLAAVSIAMHRYHEAHGSSTGHVRVCMPVSVRTEEDTMGGNRITLERFDLPVGAATARERMAEIRRICADLRADPAIPYASAIAGVLNLLPVDVTASMLKNVDLLTSNVPGFDADVYVGGAHLESFHVFGPTLGSAANVTLMSYRKTCHLGVTMDAGAIDDPERFGACLREAFAEVGASAGGQRPARRAAERPARRPKKVPSPSEMPLT